MSASTAEVSEDGALSVEASFTRLTLQEKIPTNP